jgi:hypothetical protein
VLVRQRATRLAGLLAAIWVASGCVAQKVVVRERVLGPAPETTDLGWAPDVQVSPDGRRCVYHRVEDGRARWYVSGKPGPLTRCCSYSSSMWGATGRHVRYLACEGMRKRPTVRLFVDLEPGPVFNEIESYGFNADGTRLGYFARRGTKWMPVVDGAIGPEYDERGYVRFSPDGKRVAWYGRRGDAWYATFDGEEFGPYEAIERVMYGADSERTILFATREGTPYVIINGEEVCEGRYTFFSRYPPQGDREVLAVYRPGGMQVIVGGQPGPTYPQLAPRFGGDLAFTFSPDGQHFGFVAYRGGKAFLVLDGHEGPPFDDATLPVFSPDSRRSGYTGERADMECAVIDGEAGPEYDSIYLITFSGDSRHVAYVATRRHKRLVVIDGVGGPEYDEGGSCLQTNPLGAEFGYQARRGDQWFVVIDRAEGAPYDKIEPHDAPFFSSDGKHVAYKARKGERWAFVLDAGEGPWYDAVHLHWDGPFSPDSQRFAYTGMRGEQKCAVVDGVEGPLYDEITHVWFSGDSKHYAYHAYRVHLSKRKYRLWGEDPKPVFEHIPIRDHYMVVDGVDGPRFDAILAHHPYVSRRGVVHYLAIRDDMLYRVKHTPVDEEG